MKFGEFLTLDSFLSKIKLKFSDDKGFQTYRFDHRL